MTPTRCAAAAAALTMAATLLLAARPARACSCMEIGPEKAIEQSDAIFEGRVVGVAPAQQGDIGPSDVQVVLRVVRAWKGVGQDQEQIEVRTAGNSAACGYDFEPDRSYLVYANEGSDGTLRVSLCSRTQLIEQAGEDLEVLGAGVTPVEVEDTEKKPAAEEVGTKQKGGCASCTVTPARAAPTGLMALALAVLLAWRRRRA